MKHDRGGRRASLNRHSIAPDESVFAREAARRLARRLGYLKLDPGRILDAGCGSGAHFPLLAGLYPNAGIIGVDGASALGARQRTLAARIGAVFGRRSAERICADLARLPFAAASFGAVWSNVALFAFPDPGAVFKEFARVLEPGGVLAFSTFGPDTLKELKRSFSALDSVSRVRRFADMHDLGDLLLGSGFEAPVMDVDTVVFTYESVQALIDDLRRARGAGAPEPRAGLTGRAAWHRMLDAYRALRVHERIPATVELVFGHAWKPIRSREARAKVIKLHR